ncbi:MAG: MFS transporter [Tissierellaceae bacterium]|nr:MFS transporter [Tissierellaceae bacterium]
MQLTEVLKLNKNKNIHILCIIAFLQGLVFYGPISTLFRQNRGLSLNDIFVIETVYVILLFIFEIPWGYIADRIGYRWTLIISFFLFFLSKIVFYSAHSFDGFLFERIILALAISGISGCDSALIYTSVDEMDSNRAFSLYNASSAGGFLAASFLNSIIVKYSMDLTALLTIIPYGAAFFISFFLKDSSHHVESQRISLTDNIKVLKKNKNIIIFLISMALISESTHSICVYLNQPIYLRSSIDMKYFGFLTAFMQIACLLSARAYKLNEKVGTKKLYIVLISMIIGANVFLLYLKNGLLVVLMIFIIEGAFAVTQPLSNTIQNRSITVANRATFLSSYAMVGDIIGSISNLAVGKASDFSLNIAIGTCAGLNILALILILIFFRKKKNK